MLASAVDVDEHWQRGKAAWPDIDVARERFAAELARHGEVAKSADLYIAIACIDGNDRAIAEELSYLVPLPVNPAQVTEGSLLRDVFPEVCREDLPRVVVIISREPEAARRSDGDERCTRIGRHLDAAVDREVVPVGDHC